jgi:hypothetical protein
MKLFCQLGEQSHGSTPAFRVPALPTAPTVIPSLSAAGNLCYQSLSTLTCDPVESYLMMTVQVDPLMARGCTCRSKFIDVLRPRKFPNLLGIDPAPSDVCGRLDLFTMPRIFQMVQESGEPPGADRALELSTLTTNVRSNAVTKILCEDSYPNPPEYKKKFPR